MFRNIAVRHRVVARRQSKKTSRGDRGWSLPLVEEARGSCQLSLYPCLGTAEHGFALAGFIDGIVGWFYDRESVELEGQRG